MNTQDGGTNRYQVPGLLAIFRRKNRSREPLYTELTVLLTASSRKSQSASIFRCTSVLPLRLLIEWWQIIDKSYSGVLYGTKIFRISMVIMYTYLSITRWRVAGHEASCFCSFDIMYSTFHRRPDNVVSEHKRRAIGLWVILIVGIVTCESAVIAPYRFVVSQGKKVICTRHITARTAAV